MKGCGPAIAWLRERAGLSKAELARALDIEQSGISVLESANSWPTTKNLDRVLAVLGATAHDLAKALDHVNSRSLPSGGYELREAAHDPIDQLADRFHADLRALVEEVKRRSPKG